jgi:hypothetical protein
LRRPPLLLPVHLRHRLFIGDPVVKTGTSDADGYSEVNAAANGGSITGVVVGFEDVASMLLGYGAASTTRAVLVADDPELLFEVQEDAVGGTLALAVGRPERDLIAAAGSTSTRTSGWMLDTSTKATGATLQCKIVEFQHRADNTPASAQRQGAGQDQQAHRTRRRGGL